MSVDAQFFFFFEKQLEVLLIILSQQFFFLLFSSFFLTKNNSNIGTRTCQYCSSTCILYRIHTAAFYSKYRLKPRFDHGKKKHMYKPFRFPHPTLPLPYEMSHLHMKKRKSFDSFDVSIFREKLCPFVFPSGKPLSP